MYGTQELAYTSFVCCLFVFTEIYGFGKPFRKSKSYGTMVPWPGGWSSATALDKNLHRDLRRNISSGFSHENLKRFEPAVIENLEIYVKKLTQWPCSVDGWGPPVEVHSWSTPSFLSKFYYPSSNRKSQTIGLHSTQWLSLDSVPERRCLKKRKSDTS